MVKSEKKIILKAILKSGTVNSYGLLATFNKKNPVNGPFSFMEEFDDVVMRYIRRLAADGYLKRTARGFYKITKSGKKAFKKMM